MSMRRRKFMKKLTFVYFSTAKPQHRHSSSVVVVMENLFGQTSRYGWKDGGGRGRI